MSTVDDTGTDHPEDRPASSETVGPRRDAFTPAQWRQTNPVEGFVKMPHIQTMDFSGLLGIRTIAEQVNSMLQATVPRIVFDGYRPGLLDFAENFNKAIWANVAPALERLAGTIQKLFPPNWGDARPRDWDEFKHMLAHEGIPVLWVPGPEIVAAIFEAETAAARRRVISSRWKGIVRDCETVLEGVAHRQLTDECGFALDCVKALRDGHTAAAQALATNLLDSALQKGFEKDKRVKLTGNKFKQNGVTFDYDDFHFRAALTFAPVWCAHAQYWPDKGDPIPAEYGRHPSTHGVSRRQYKRVNAVIALMLVTSVIKFFDDELARRGK
ncbi:hypothetical protein [Actinomadura bangladeshensis]|uniref:Uncharacterized protein n=1 Tax=Actinomadura bangladeshensis TaxID=453573 RepID=A0A6L9Q918_9ACTN|nr:hypothetical protein [Actinomadura bangladeshensis]NEA21606.1 hypothetical protein [Actinomadura bangladeshensis]NEA22566.1 hypothetical protein [Actinomadura bangladeshensis]